MTAQQSVFPNLTLSFDRVDIWLLFASAVTVNLIDSYRDLLTAEEKHKEQHFYFKRDRISYLLTRVLIRTTLSRYIPIAPKDWHFEPDRYGRPRAVNSHKLLHKLSFNISHTDGLIVLAVTVDRAVGIDAEYLHRTISTNVLESYFSTHETNMLHKLPSSMRRIHCLDLWTFKESYIKARGTGLSMPLNKFSINLTNSNEAPISFDGIDDLPDRWAFYRIRPSTDYTMALCIERLTNTEPLLVNRTVVPLFSEKIMQSQAERLGHPAA